MYTAAHSLPYRSLTLGKETQNKLITYEQVLPPSKFHLLTGRTATCQQIILSPTDNSPRQTAAVDCRCFQVACIIDYPNHALIKRERSRFQLYPVVGRMMNLSRHPFPSPDRTHVTEQKHASAHTRLLVGWGEENSHGVSPRRLLDNDYTG